MGNSIQNWMSISYSKQEALKNGPSKSIFYKVNVHQIPPNQSDKEFYLDQLGAYPTALNEGWSSNKIKEFNNAIANNYKLQSTNNKQPIIASNIKNPENVSYYKQNNKILQCVFTGKVVSSFYNEILEVKNVQPYCQSNQGFVKINKASNK